MDDKEIFEPHSHLKVPLYEFRFQEKLPTNQHCSLLVTPSLSPSKGLVSNMFWPPEELQEKTFLSREVLGFARSSTSGGQKLPVPDDSKECPKCQHEEKKLGRPGWLCGAHFRKVRKERDLDREWEDQTHAKYTNECEEEMEERNQYVPDPVDEAWFPQGNMKWIDPWKEPECVRSREGGELRGNQNYSRHDYDWSYEGPTRTNPFLVGGRPMNAPIPWSNKERAHDERLWVEERMEPGICKLCREDVLCARHFFESRVQTKLPHGFTFQRSTPSPQPKPVPIQAARSVPSQAPRPEVVPSLPPRARAEDDLGCHISARWPPIQSRDAMVHPKKARWSAARKAQQRAQRLRGSMEYSQSGSRRSRSPDKKLHSRSSSRLAEAQGVPGPVNISHSPAQVERDMPVPSRSSHPVEEQSAIPAKAPLSVQIEEYRAHLARKRSTFPGWPSGRRKPKKYGKKCKEPKLLAAPLEFKRGVWVHFPTRPPLQSIRFKDFPNTTIRDAAIQIEVPHRNVGTTCHPRKLAAPDRCNELLDRPVTEAIPLQQTFPPPLLTFEVEKTIPVNKDSSMWPVARQVKGAVLQAMRGVLAGCALQPSTAAELGNEILAVLDESLAAGCGLSRSSFLASEEDDAAIAYPHKEQEN